MNTNANTTAPVAPEYFGDLHRTGNGEYLRSATRAEAAESSAIGSVHGCTGPIEVDGESCYVENAQL